MCVCACVRARVCVYVCVLSSGLVWDMVAMLFGARERACTGARTHHTHTLACVCARPHCPTIAARILLRVLGVGCLAPDGGAPGTRYTRTLQSLCAMSNFFLFYVCFFTSVGFVLIRARFFFLARHSQRPESEKKQLLKMELMSHAPCRWPNARAGSNCSTWLAYDA